MIERRIGAADCRKVNTQGGLPWWLVEKSAHFGGLLRPSFACYFFLLLWSCHLYGQEPLDDAVALLDQAVKQYSSAMDESDRDRRLQAFGRAEQLFRQATERQLSQGEVPNSHLWIGLGNAALQAENLGMAIYAFRQVMRVEPNNAQALQNLRFARALIPDPFRVEQELPFLETLFFWQMLMSRQQTMVVGASLFLVFSVLLALGIGFGRPRMRALAILPFALWLILLLSLALQGPIPADDAVVVVDSTVLYSADSENSPPRFTTPLPDGVELQVVQERDRWTEVEVAGRTGWLRSTAILPIRD